MELEIRYWCCTISSLIVASSVLSLNRYMMLCFA